MSNTSLITIVYVVFVNNGFQIVRELSDSTALRQVRVGQTELSRLKVDTIR